LDPATLSAADFFLSGTKIDRLEPCTQGNINDTYRIVLEGGEMRILQRINPNVFPDPCQVHANMDLVCQHLEKEVQGSPGHTKAFIPLVLYPGRNGETFSEHNGALWRMINYVPGITFETIRDPHQAQEVGFCLGNFHRLLASLEPFLLYDTLPGFHDTARYLRKYDSARAKLSAAQKEKIQWYRDVVETWRPYATLLEKTTGLTKTIIHGDPKVANFIFASGGQKAISLIDLDTVRAGLLLHDIGDGLRSCCNPAGESPGQPERITFNKQLFSAWLKGYTQGTGLLLTKQDKAHIVDAVKVISFELGLRFLTDYMEGNTYFKVDYSEHNLDRARVQFQLVQSIEAQEDDLESIARKIFI